MSLTWNLEKIEDKDQLCWISVEEDGEQKYRLNPITELLIWRTMVVDMGKITPENLEEFAYRLLLYDSIFGGAVLDNGEEHALTYEEIKAHIGLSTNVITTTRTAWRQRFLKMIEDSQGYRVQRVIEQAKKGTVA